MKHVISVTVMTASEACDAADEAAQRGLRIISVSVATRVVSTGVFERWVVFAETDGQYSREDWSHWIGARWAQKTAPLADPADPDADVPPPTGPDGRGPLPPGGSGTGTGRGTDW